MCICVYVYMYVNMCIYIYTYISIYICTHKHAFFKSLLEDALKIDNLTEAYDSEIFKTNTRRDRMGRLLCKELAEADCSCFCANADPKSTAGALHYIIIYCVLIMLYYVVLSYITFSYTMLGYFTLYYVVNVVLHCE